VTLIFILRLHNNLKLNEKLAFSLSVLIKKKKNQTQNHHQVPQNDFKLSFFYPHFSTAEYKT